jgi:DNA-binding beta-propeller fold protein YncE
MKLFLSPECLKRKGKSVRSQSRVPILFCLAVSLVSFLFSRDQVEGKDKIAEEKGVKVIKNPSESVYGELKLDLEEDLVLGKESDENYLFYQVWDIKADDTGNIYILDAGAHNIKKYDREGTYLQTIGGQGQGPGEFAMPFTLNFDKNGNIYVIQMQKVQVFDRNGVYIKSIPFSYFVMDFTPDGEGNIIVTARVRTESTDNIAVLIIGPEGKIIKKIAEFPGIPIHETGTTVSHDYSPYVRFSALGDKGIIYGYNLEYRLYCADWSGKNILIIEKNEPQHNVSRREKNKIIDTIQKNIERAELGWPKDVIEKMANVPKHRPFFNGILVDDKGRIYVKKLKSVLDDSKAPDYDIFSSVGYYLYSAQLPFAPLFIKNGYMYHATFSEESGEVKVIRTRIKNWKEIKT